MSIDSPHVRRLEWKYRVSLEQAARLGQVLVPHTDPDPHCSSGDSYRVLSLYYDTPELRFYHERKDGVKVRRKLRIRNYGDELYYLEIKRKIDKEVVKERASIRRSQVAGALNGVDPKVLMAGRRVDELRTLERFRFNMKSLGLVPTLLVGYRRQARIGRLEPSVRITIDSDLRSRMRPHEQDLFANAELRPFQERGVLELKFNGRPPRWWMELATEFGLKRESYSKYCDGIDSWGRIRRSSTADDDRNAAQGS